MIEFEIDELYVIYKDLIIDKLKIIEIDKKSTPLIAEQKYEELSLLRLNKKELYNRIRESQQRLVFYLNSKESYSCFLQTFDFKSIIEEIEEDFIAKMKIILEDLQKKSNKTKEILKQIHIIEYLIS
jgi:hypothetical protein